MPKADTLRKHGDTAPGDYKEGGAQKKRKGSAGRAKEASYSAQMAGLRGYAVRATDHAGDGRLLSG